MAPQPKPIVSWSYGTGAGEGVKYAGAPAYTRAYGMGNGEGITLANKPVPNYSYGADGMAGTMVQVVPPAK